MAGDTGYPSEMVASIPIDEAWRGLMMMPSVYSKVCRALGNDIDSIIDYDPFWQEDEGDLRQMKKRMGSTLRNYQQCFGNAAPQLYWPELQRPSQGVFSEFFRKSGAVASALQCGWHTIYPVSPTYQQHHKV
mmetsp:Transcript_9017/g.19120  ORF Transcript_9017/g.19120 Transcript_9017/m.19120 type:complete len:132 (-) Transcript_9017:169-564(-)